MALSFAHGAIQWLAADAATTVYTVSGLGFQPKALMFLWQGLGSATDTSSTTTHSRRGVGFATGTGDQRAIATQDQDAAAAMTCTRGYRTDCIALTVTSTPAVDGRLRLASITAGGFTLVVDDATPVNLTLFYAVWGGSDLTVATTLEIPEPAATGTQDYTVTGFTSGATDQVVLFAGQGGTGAAPAVTRGDDSLSFGFASGTGAENQVLVGAQTDGGAKSGTVRYQQSGECLGALTGASLTATAALTQWNANGFRLNWTARATTDRRAIGLALKGGQWRAGTLTLDATGLGTTATVSGLPFAPTGLVLGGTHYVTLGGTPIVHELALLGLGTSPTARRAMGSVSTNNANDAFVALALEYDQLAVALNTAGTVEQRLDLDAMLADGFRLINDLALGGGARHWAYLTFGEAAVAQALLEGALTGTALTVGPLTAQITAAAALTGTALSTGALTAFSLLGTAAASGTATTTGGLTTVIRCAGAASVLGTVTGDLTAVTAPALCEGAAVGLATATGGLTTVVQLAGLGLGTATLAGALTTATGFAGSVVGTATTAGALQVGVVLAATPPATATATGSLLTVVRLVGAAAGVATSTGAVTVFPSGLAGSPSGTATAAGALTTVVQLQGAASGTATGSGVLTLPLLLAATPQGTAALTGALQIGVRLQAAALATATAQAYLALTARLSGAATASSTIVGSLTTSVQVVGGVEGTATAVGSLTTAITLAGELLGTATVVGDLITRSPYDLGATLPTHTERETAIRITEPVLYPLTVARQGGVFVTEVVVIRTTARQSARRTVELRLMAELKLVEGHTGVIDEILKANGAAVNLTGMTVELVLQTAGGVFVDTTTDVTVETAAEGLVRYTPDAADLLATDTPHVARWKVTDGNGHVVFFPSEAGEVWEVQPSGPIALPDNALVTLQALKAGLSIKGNEQDLALATFITACSDALETLTGRRLVSRTYTDEYVYVRADQVLGIEWLDVESPITALTSLSINGTAQSVWTPGALDTPEDYDVFLLEGRDPKHGRDRLFRPGGWTVGSLVRRTYTAGYGVEGPPAFPIPADLTQGVLTLAVDWYYLQTRQAEPVISRSAGAETVTYVNEALPRRFPMLINAYRRWR